MNKELIKKYKPEFDHWLNGGKLLIKMSTGWEPVPLEYAWHLTSKLIVIDDSYSHYRKALAEGKTIQYRNTSVNGFENWEDLNGLSFNPNFEHRIKPEEPQLKVGDWVIDLRDNNLKQVVNPNSPAALSDYIKWKPKQGEWGWNIVFGLVKIICKTGTEDYYVCWNPWKKVEQTCTIEQPFIGQLPTHLKD